MVWICSVLITLQLSHGTTPCQVFYCIFSNLFCCRPYCFNIILRATKGVANIALEMPLSPSTHAQQRYTIRKKMYDRGRPSATARGYDARWRKQRVRGLALEPLCRECKKRGRITAATVRDHIVPIAQGGSNEESNIQSLCAPCHNRKTMLEMRAVHFG